jgi:hypothetical protein
MAQQSSQHVAGVLATAAFRQHAASQIGQPERVVQFTVAQQAGVGGDAAAVEFQLQPPVEIDPQGSVIRFDHWGFHPRASDPVIIV